MTLKRIRAPFLALLVATAVTCKTRTANERTSRDGTTNPGESGAGDVQVVGGSEVVAGQYPGLLSLPAVACTGVLISEKRVLTAKHCVKNLSDGVTTTVVPAFVTASSSTVSGQSPGASHSKKIVKIVRHGSLDVAVLHLDSALAGVTLATRAALPPDPRRLLMRMFAMVGAGCTVRPPETSQPVGPEAGHQPGAGDSGGVILTSGVAVRRPTPVATGLPALDITPTYLPTPTAAVPPAPTGAVDKPNGYQALVVSERFFETNDWEISYKVTPTPAQIANGTTPGLCQGDSGGPLFVRERGAWKLLAINNNFHRSGESRFTRIDFAAPSEMQNWLRQALQ